MAGNKASEMFRQEVVSRLNAGGLPLSDVLAAVDKAQGEGHEGGHVQLLAADFGVDIVLLIRDESTDFTVGKLGPFVVSTSVVREIAAEVLPQEGA